MKIAFNPKNEIINHKDLFGREEIFRQLIALANRRSNTQLIGLRRFGKTSLLKSIESYFLKNDDTNIFPIYCDFKEVSEIKGTPNVYRYLTSLIISSLSKKNIFEEPEEFRGQIITPSNIWEDVFIELGQINDIRIPGIFEEVTTFFADLIEKTFLFLFDEYEFLFRFSFDKPVGFMKLRNFASKLTKKGLNPFIFFVSGGTTWEHLCSITGSGELNCIDQIVFVPPISFDSFKMMWEHEVNLIDNCPTELKTGVGYAFKASGGVPFYGKIIGSKWYTSKTKPNYSVLNSHLKEVFNSLENEQKDILIEIIKKKTTLKSSEYLLDLREKGLINKRDNKYSISLDFLTDFIKSISKKQNNDLAETEKLTQNIETLIISINKTHENKKGEYIFLPVNDDLILFRDLRTECFTAEQFANFSSSIYHIVFERTKKEIAGKNKTKARLPSNFKRKNKFLNAIDIMRHSLGRGHLMDTFSQNQGQMTKNEMLFYLTGSKNEPVNPDDFYALQIKTLELFEKELIKLKTIVEKM